MEVSPFQSPSQSPVQSPLQLSSPGSEAARSRVRILVVSQRQVPQKDWVANAVPFEFEDWIAALDQAQVIAPRPRRSRLRDLRAIWMALGSASNRVSPTADTPFDGLLDSPQVERSHRQSLKNRFKNYFKNYFKNLLKTLLWATPLSHWIAPQFEPIAADDLAEEYDLLYCIFSEPWEVFSLRSLPDWRKRCKFAVCHFVELWPKELDDLALLKQEYAQFDKLYSNTFFTTSEITEITGVSCQYLPLTVDAIKFCPYPNPPERSIDVTYIGRRSTITHDALLNVAQTRNLFYLYDTAKQFRTANHAEHRTLLAMQLKRSRYFFANCSKLDDACSQGRMPEFGWRFFEGLASGAIVLGKTPDTEIFRQYFDWPNAVVSLSFDLPNIAEILTDLDQRDEQLAQARYDSILNALQRYDWLYIWSQILRDFDLATTEKMQQRQCEIDALVERVKAERVKAERGKADDRDRLAHKTSHTRRDEPPFVRLLDPS